MGDYKRVEVDPGPFAAILPDGAKLYAPSFKLPVVEGEIGGWKIKVTDLRPLHPSARVIIESVATWAANTGECEAVFVLPDGMDEDELNLICDIATEFDFSARNKRLGIGVNCRLVSSFRRTGEKLVACMNPEMAEDFKRYTEGLAVKEGEQERADLIAMLLFHTEESSKRYRQSLKEAD